MLSALITVMVTWLYVFDKHILVTTHITVNYISQKSSIVMNLLKKNAMGSEKGKI